LDVADAAPSGSALTPYDEEHLVTYLRLLDADAEGADCRRRCGVDRSRRQRTAGLLIAS
jgi:hypothetical protein